MSIIDKIFNEEPLVQNESFHIVKDKNPICPLHLMAFHKERPKSLSLVQNETFNRLLESIHQFYNNDFYFFERGNASFCTSISETTCSHIHFLPKKYFDNKLMEILIDKSIQIGYSQSVIKPTTKEYFFFGDSENKHCFILNKIPEKQFFRKNFKNRLN